MNPERAFEVRIVDGEESPGYFEGYASVFGVVDSYGTVFNQGAFKKTIKERKGWLPIVWMHNPNEPIGRAEVSEDEKGLWVKGQLDLDVQRGREVYSGMRKGYITQMSHSFSGVKQKTVEAEDKSKIPHFLEVRSYEISPVTTNFASNEEAMVTSVRTTEPVREMISPELAFQMGRLEALLAEPRSTHATEPQGKPGDHLQRVDKELTRLMEMIEG